MMLDRKNSGYFVVKKLEKWSVGDSWRIR